MFRTLILVIYLIIITRVGIHRDHGLVQILVGSENVILGSWGQGRFRSLVIVGTVAISLLFVNFRRGTLVRGHIFVRHTSWLAPCFLWFWREVDKFIIGFDS